jgi:hypothetical protein
MAIWPYWLPTPRPRLFQSIRHDRESFTRIEVLQQIIQHHLNCFWGRTSTRLLAAPARASNHIATADLAKRHSARDPECQLAMQPELLGDEALTLNPASQRPSTTDVDLTRASWASGARLVHHGLCNAHGADYAGCNGDSLN